MCHLHLTTQDAKQLPILKSYITHHMLNRVHVDIQLCFTNTTILSTAFPINSNHASKHTYNFEDVGNLFASQKALVILTVWNRRSLAFPALLICIFSIRCHHVATRAASTSRQRCFTAELCTRTCIKWTSMCKSSTRKLSKVSFKIII